MNSYYSLIKISPNPSAGDLITIGLLLKSENKVFLKFSENKIRIAQRLLGLEENLISFFKKKLESNVDLLNEDLRNKTNKLFDFTSIINSEYLSHLSNISNNLIQFSDPSFIATAFDEKQFLKFYCNMVDNSEEDLEITLSFVNNKLDRNVKEKIITRLENRVHTNININKRILPSLNFSINIDCLGKNGSIIAAKAINLDATPRTIETNIMRYDVALTKINEKYGNNGYEAIIIADEPIQKESENYNIWEILNKKETFIIYNSDNVENVAELVESKNAHKFLDIEE